MQLILSATLPRLFSFSLKEQKPGTEDTQQGRGEGTFQEAGFSTRENPWADHKGRQSASFTSVSHSSSST